ncbi:MAG: hypothetical protein LBI35_04880 [Burkholderiales bacterium]|nr:hypothetical protein [Burkholderiales bacterium]
MKSSFRIYLGVALLVIVISSCFGFFYGKRERDNIFKIYITVGSVLATEDFDEGNIEQALSGAYRVKAFERERSKPDPLMGETLTDGLLDRPAMNLLLGKIFLEKKQPCLSQSYLIDGFTYLNQEKAFLDLPMYKETTEMLLAIGKNCAQWKEAL